MWLVASTSDNIASALARKIRVTHKAMHLVSRDFQGPWNSSMHHLGAPGSEAVNLCTEGVTVS